MKQNVHSHITRKCGRQEPDLGRSDSNMPAIAFSIYLWGTGPHSNRAIYISSKFHLVSELKIDFHLMSLLFCGVPIGGYCLPDGELDIQKETNGTLVSLLLRYGRSQTLEGRVRTAVGDRIRHAERA